MSLTLMMRTMTISMTMTLTTVFFNNDDSDDHVNFHDEFDKENDIIDDGNIIDESMMMMIAIQILNFLGLFHLFII